MLERGLHVQVNKWLQWTVRNPQQTRQKLLQAAIQELVTLGSAGIRVDRLAAKAGINKRMIYHYFGNREGLYAWALASQIARLDRYALEQRERSNPEGHLPQISLAGVLTGLLVPLLPDASADLSAADLALLATEHDADALGVQRAAIIVLRALLDLRGAQPEYRLAHSDEAALRRVMPWLTALVTSQGSSGTDDVSVRSVKPRISLSPVVQVI